MTNCNATLVHFVFCVGLMLGASTAWSQIGTPTEQPPKGEKVDEQTPCKPHTGEGGKKRQMAEEARRRPPEKPAQSVQRGHGLNHPTR